MLYKLFMDNWPVLLAFVGAAIIAPLSTHRYTSWRDKKKLEQEYKQKLGDKLEAIWSPAERMIKQFLLAVMLYKDDENVV
jgi:hypothetical protein